MAKELTPVDETRAREDEFYEIDLVDLMLTLWKRKLIIIASTIIFAAGAAAYIATAPKIYESKSTLAFLLSVDTSTVPQQLPLIPDTFLTLATADDLLNDLMKELSSDTSGEGTMSINALRNGLSVKFVEPDRSRRTQTPSAMTASFRAKNPETAVKVLSTWTRLFIEKCERLPVDRNTTALESLEKALEDTEKKLLAAEGRLLAYEKENPISLLEIQLEVKGESYAGLLKQKEEKSTVDLDERIERAKREYAEISAQILDAKTETERLLHEKETLSESLSTLSQQYRDLRITTDDTATPLKVIENPTTPQKPVSPRGKRILALASLLGLFVGTTLALLAEMIAKRKSAAQTM